MTHVVITGASRGIGRGLAAAFLREGCRVTIGSRDAGAVARAVEELRAECSTEVVSGCACDVSRYDDVRALSEFAEGLAPIDVWVNNAGANVPPGNLWEQAPSLLSDVASTNFAGVLFGAHAALRVMTPRGRGKIYNLEGLGADGSALRGFAAYGATKRAVRYLSRALAAEARPTGVIVATVDPGVVATRMLEEIAPATAPALEPFIAALAQPVNDVAPHLARSMLRNVRTGARLRAVGWLWVLCRIATVPFRRRVVPALGS
jgi:NAD(P)-dependent dehydrogenase (short-subunit alcohol dehydrogenase family)